MIHEDRFVVFVRFAPGSATLPEAVEGTQITCSSYEEARRVRRSFQHRGRGWDCIIRFVGPAGGGD